MKWTTRTAFCVQPSNHQTNRCLRCELSRRQGKPSKEMSCVTNFWHFTSYPCHCPYHKRVSGSSVKQARLHFKMLNRLTIRRRFSISSKSQWRPKSRNAASIGEDTCWWEMRVESVVQHKPTQYFQQVPATQTKATFPASFVIKRAKIEPITYLQSDPSSKGSYARKFSLRTLSHQRPVPQYICQHSQEWRLLCPDSRGCAGHSVVGEEHPRTFEHSCKCASTCVASLPKYIPWWRLRPFWLIALNHDYAGAGLVYTHSPTFRGWGILWRPCAGLRQLRAKSPGRGRNVNSELMLQTNTCNKPADWVDHEQSHGRDNSRHPTISRNLKFYTTWFFINMQLWQFDYCGGNYMVAACKRNASIDDCKKFWGCYSGVGVMLYLQTIWERRTQRIHCLRKTESTKVADDLQFASSN